jgi:hypothetical protein
MSIIHITNVRGANMFRGYEAATAIAPATNSAWRRFLDTLMNALSVVAA